MMLFQCLKQHCLDALCFPLAIESLLRHSGNRSQQDAYPSPRLSSWKALNCCEWNGVHCDPHSSHVVEIHLHKFLDPYEVNGVINRALFELKHLEYLDLSWNGLTGAIPAGAQAFGSQLELVRWEYTRGTWLLKFRVDKKSVVTKISVTRSRGGEDEER
eukprot:Gb_33220 [translate_table: standard]